MRKKHISNYWKGMNICKVPYCQNPAIGIDAPKCSEECYKFDNCTSYRKRNYTGENKVNNTHTENTTSSTNNSGLSLNVDGEEYDFDKIIKILKKHKKEEDKKYSTCYKCGIKYLENKKFNMIHENLENDTDLKPGMAIGYQGTPFITGIQVTSKCGTGKKIKLCDNCIRELVLFLKGD